MNNSLKPMFELVQRTDFYRVQPGDFDPDGNFENEIQVLDTLCRGFLGKSFGECSWTEVNVLAPDTDLVEDYEKTFEQVTKNSPTPELRPEGSGGSYWQFEADGLAKFIFVKWEGDDFIISNIQEES